MTTKTVEDCDCFGWGSEYTVTAGHHIRCEHRVAQPAPLRSMLSSIIKDIKEIWQLHGATDVETLESIHYVLGELKSEVTRQRNVAWSKK